MVLGNRQTHPLPVVRGRKLRQQQPGSLSHQELSSALGRGQERPPPVPTALPTGGTQILACMRATRGHGPSSLQQRPHLFATTWGYGVSARRTTSTQELRKRSSAAHVGGRFLFPHVSDARTLLRAPGAKGTTVLPHTAGTPTQSKSGVSSSGEMGLTSPWA